MRHLLITLCLCVLSLSLAGQTPRLTIKGIVADTLAQPLQGAYVMLLLPSDSTMESFTRTNKAGEFEFKNIKRQPYLLKTSFMGMLPLQQLITPEEANPSIDIGQLIMTPLNEDLMEVVIRTAKAPLSIKGDTIEYNAGSFKVPPGSTVEDLLRRLPGMEVDNEGNLKAQGQQVQRVTVDGKRFFGGDPKAATRNLSADAISKVQVFDGKSEEAKITGIEDGKKEKTVNLELKDSHKKGAMGKASVGLGTRDRITGRVNYNRFDDKNQFSILGYGNNTNEAGLDWGDYSSFMGTSVDNQYKDQGDFGFSSSVMMLMSNDDESLTLSPGMGRTSNGFSKNWGAGTNYNYDTKKVSLNTSYFYNQTDVDVASLNYRKSFLPTGSFENNSSTFNNRFLGNHRGTVRYENKIDSSRTFVFLTNLRIANGITANTSTQESFFLEEPQIGNSSTANSIDDRHAFNMMNTAIYNHKFKKKGRSFAMSGSLLLNDAESDRQLNSTNQFRNDSTLIINQYQGTNDKNHQLKTSAQYSEPIGKSFLWVPFVNFSHKSGDVNRLVNDRNDNSEFINTNLSRYYTHSITFSRLGNTLRYNKNGFNIAAGFGVQDVTIKGDFAVQQGGNSIGNLKNSTTSFVPNFEFNYNKSGMYASASYNKNIDIPSITSLQPIVDNSNPLYIVVGNPDLRPSIRNYFRTYFNTYNQSSFTGNYISLSYSLTNQAVVQSQVIDENLVTTIKPINVDGGKGFTIYGGRSGPIIKNKLTYSLSLSYDYSDFPIPTNGVMNDTYKHAIGIRPGLSLKLGDKLNFSPSFNWNPARTNYSINTAQNQQTLNTSYSAYLSLKLPMEVYLNSNFNYTIYQNKTLDFTQGIPIWYIAVRRIFLKSKKAELRLSVNDLLDRNRGISIVATQNYVQTTQTNTLARYYQLTFTYSLRGMK